MEAILTLERESDIVSDDIPTKRPLLSLNRVPDYYLILKRRRYCHW